MPRDNEKLHVVDQILHRHPLSGFRILRRQHVIEEIIRQAGSLAAACLDRCGYHIVHGSYRGACQQFSRAGKPFRESEKVQQRGAARCLEVLGDGVAEGGAIEMLPPRKSDVANDVKSRGQHFRDDFSAPATGRQPPAHTLRGCGHGRGKGYDVAVCEHGRDGLALPFPVGAIRIEQAVPDGRPQHAAHDLRLGVIGEIVQHDTFHARRVGQHMPPHQHFAGNDRLAIGQGGNDLQHVAPGDKGGFQPAEAAAVNGRSGRDKGLRHVSSG